MAVDETLHIEVAYATLEKQCVLELSLPVGCSAEQAIRASGILHIFPAIDLTTQTIGIFGHICQLEQTLQDGDRVEIYRPLTQDPMAARRNRAQR
ncbi:MULTISPECIES: RnfH family protein [Methylomonas]|uniref:RnfH family protein n=1 Tax=Methylomonas TaxID=416 RepID=UPI001231DB8B|nr:RnfH family protein [Methylomonas rhizoryzae]